MNRPEQAIRKEIGTKQAALDALRDALAMLTSAGGRASAGGPRRGKRRPKTAAEKAVLSKAMRAAWRRRKAAGGAKRGKRANKGSKAATA